MRGLFVLLSLCAICALRTSAQSDLSELRPIAQLHATLAPQQKIAECDFSAPVAMPIGVGRFSTSTDGTVVIKGEAKNGTAWSAEFSAFPGAGCELWQSDLEQTGEPALLFVQYGGNSSGGWDTTLTILLFDKDGVPFPWQAKGRFDVTERQGLDNLILGDDKRPAVIVATRRIDGEAKHIDAYDLYRFRGTRSERIEGDFGGIHWPKYSASGTGQGTPRSAAHTLSTANGTSAANILSSNSSIFKGMTGNDESDRRILLSNAKVALPEVLVVDKGNSRKIVSYPQSSDFSAIPANRAHAVALGNDCEDSECNPVILWFRQTPEPK